MKKMLCLLAIALPFIALQAQPLDGITEKTIVKEKKLLQYAPLREGDILWEKRVWRLLDTREKMNLPFAYPEKPFFEVLKDAAMDSEIVLYESDDFQHPIEQGDVAELFSSTDTVYSFDPEIYIEELIVVRNDIDYELIKRFRIKEVWFVDQQTATMQVRILGIAPLIDVMDDNGNFLYEKPLFWTYFPELRNILARHTVMNPANQNDRTTWDDLFEQRHFASSIYKDSNVLDLALKNLYTGTDLLLESQKINAAIFNFEHDMWSY